MIAKTQDRKIRQLKTKLEWLLEDYAEIDKEFSKIIGTENIVTNIVPIEDKFFYRISFVGPEGSSNEAISSRLYAYISKVLETTSGSNSQVRGIAVNFVGDKR